MLGDLISEDYRIVNVALDYNKRYNSKSVQNESSNDLFNFVGNFDACNFFLFLYQEFKDTEGRVHIELKTELSSLVIEGAERSDEGSYNIVVTNPVGEDKATLIIKVVGKLNSTFSL